MMQQTKSVQTKSVQRLAALACAAVLASGCAGEARAEGESGPELSDAAVDEELRGQLDDLAARTRELEDREAIRDAAACYGQGHDEIFGHLGADQTESLAILRECHTDDLATKVFFFDESTPTDELASLEELVGFIEQFAIDTGYTGARNVVGDIRIDFTGPDTAVMTSATQTPHFIQGTADPAGAPTLDVVSARYVDELRRGEDGVWRSHKKSLIIDQIWRGIGFYPFAAQ
jgi:SnoaL-like domain